MGKVSDASAIRTAIRRSQASAAESGRTCRMNRRRSRRGVSERGGEKSRGWAAGAALERAGEGGLYLPVASTAS